MVLHNMIQLIVIIMLMIKSCYSDIGFGTLAVHSGCDVDSATGGIIPAINLGTTFAQHQPGQRPGKEDLNSHGNGFFYSRFENPTRLQNSDQSNLEY